MKSSITILITLFLCFVFASPSFADPIEDAKAAVSNQDYKKALEIITPLAEQDNLQAQTMLGAMYVNGQGVEANPTKGLELITNAAKKGYEPAKIVAFNMNIELANKGDSAAMFNVGYMCFNGWGGTHESSVCLKWLETAGEIGHEKAAKILTKIYTEGKFGVTPDETKATYWKEQQAAIAAGIDGTWEGSVSMGGGAPPMKLSYTFKKEGETLTGTTKGYEGKNNPIKDGKMDGNNFTFVVESEFNGAKMTINYSGTFYGKNLKLTYTSAGGPGGAPAPAPVTFIAKRAI
jgi:hypothetical protein